MFKTKLILVAVLAVPLMAHSAVFKCVEDGVVTYSDLPCDNKDSKDTSDPKKPVTKDETAIAAQEDAD